MTNTTTKEHWETVYETKNPNQVSWTQEEPKTSLALIRSFNLPKNANIIDVGGGDSKLVDYLLDDGFEKITVLDISAKALDKAKVRLGNKSSKVNWVVSNILDYRPNIVFDLWHDRAAFHFLTTEEEIAVYTNTVKKSVNNYIAIGVFSTNGPKKCSGLDIKQYDENSLNEQFTDEFNKLMCTTENHITPFDTIQNFVFCGFKRKNN
jgi:trans-aconitate methyltransferase